MTVSLVWRSDAVLLSRVISKYITYLNVAYIHVIASIFSNTLTYVVTTPNRLKPKLIRL